MIRYLGDLWFRMRGTLFRKRLDAELDEELGDHTARLEARLLGRGLTPQAACQAARREIGSVLRIREAHRAERSLIGLEDCLRDLRYAARGLLEHPGYALTAIVSIALAIGANSAIFSYADGLLLRPLPVPNPGGVVSLRAVSPSLDSGIIVGGDRISYRDFEDYRDSLASFEHLVAFTDIGASFSTRPTNGEALTGYLVSGNLFEGLGVEIPLGRGFLAAEDEVPGRDAVVVLAHGVWMTRFAGDPSVIGRTVRIDGIEFTVVGVAPESLSGLDLFIRPDFFVPAMMGPALLGARGEAPSARLLIDRSLRGFRVKGRLRSGVGVREASAEATLVASSIAEAHPDTNRGWGVVVSAERTTRLATYPLLGLLVTALFTVVGVNLLVASANVANLMLTRGRARSREIAIRLALGAGRGRMVRLLLAESLLITVGAGALALVVADLAIGVFSTLKVDPNVTLTFAMDTRVVSFTVLVSLASVLLFGLMPALQATRTDLVSATKSGTGDAGLHRTAGRNVLATAQIAGAMVLLVGATGFRILFDQALTNDPGFARERRITMQLQPDLAGYSDEAAERFFDDLVDRSVELPGIRSAALTSNIPLTWFFLRMDTVVPEDYALPEDRDGIDVFYHVVDEHYFDTMRTRITSGRGFLASDDEGHKAVAVVNEAFASRYLGEDPIGARVRLGDRDGPVLEVVGVTVTAKNLSVIEPPVPLLYLPFTQNPSSTMALVAETDGDPGPLASSLLDMIHSRDPDVPISRVQTMEAVFETGSVSMLRVVRETYDAASLMGLFLALIGLYSVLSYQVARRTREIGVRMALGAQADQVIALFLRRAAPIVVVGLGIGTLLSLVAGGTVDQSLGGVGLNPTPLVIVILFMLATTTLASFIPARRAARVDPQRALREE
jgi:putative ABC transport system permease protein